MNTRIVAVAFSLFLGLAGTQGAAPVARVVDQERLDVDALWSNLPVPRVGVRLEDHAPFSGAGIKTYVWIQMPQIPLQWGKAHNVFDVLYEQPYGLELLGSRMLEGGVFEMRHRLGRQPTRAISSLEFGDRQSRWAWDADIRTQSRKCRQDDRRQLFSATLG